MSKGKYKRKREHAKQHTEEQASQAKLLGAVRPLQKKPKSTRYPQPERKDKEENSMGLREAAKRSSLTDWLLTAFTLVLAVVAIYQFVIMSGQLEAMKDQVKVARRDQRPWIKVTFTKSDLKAFSSDLGEVRFSNIGKTPALQFHAVYRVEFIDVRQAPDLDLTGIASDVTTGTVFPGDDPIQKDPVQRIVGDKLAYFTPEEVEDYGRGDKYVVFVIRVTYTDSTGADYWTQYCTFHGEHEQPVPARTCTNYNSTDQN